jgi:arsenate reductase-like glutaredoxin family protein
MGVISKDKRKLTIYYHSDTSIGQQTFAYANASEKKLHAVDIAKNTVTGTQWVELAGELGKKLSELIHTDHPDFIKKHGKNPPSMEEHHWLKILENEPQFLKYPIVIYGKEYLQIESAAAFKKFIEPDSAGLEKQPLRDQFTDKDTPK